MGKSTFPQGEQPIGQADRGQAGAAGEGCGVDIPQAVRDGHLGQGGAVFKGVGADFLKAFAQRHFLQGGAAGKGVIAHLLNASGHLHADDSVVVPESALVHRADLQAAQLLGQDDAALLAGIAGDYRLAVHYPVGVIRLLPRGASVDEAGHAVAVQLIPALVAQVQTVGFQIGIHLADGIAGVLQLDHGGDGRHVGRGHGGAAHGGKAAVGGAADDAGTGSRHVDGVAVIAVAGLAQVGVQGGHGDDLAQVGGNGIGGVGVVVARRNHHHRALGLGIIDGVGVDAILAVSGGESAAQAQVDHLSARVRRVENAVDDAGRIAVALVVQGAHRQDVHL